MVGKADKPNESAVKKSGGDKLVADQISRNGPFVSVPKIKIGFQQFELPSLALFLMLVGVVLPSALYSYRLTDPTPPELLVAICVALFSSVVFLWILDAISILRFRSEWVSKSIYGAAIASVLGTSVAVYKDAFASRKFPYEGAWQLQIEPKSPIPSALLSILISHSEQSDTYWGYSEYRTTKEPAGIIWAHIADFYPKGTGASASVRLYYADGKDKLFSSQNFRADRRGKLFEGSLFLVISHVVLNLYVTLWCTRQTVMTEVKDTYHHARLRSGLPKRYRF